MAGGHAESGFRKSAMRHTKLSLPKTSPRKRLRCFLRSCALRKLRAALAAAPSSVAVLYLSTKSPSFRSNALSP
eukprot:6043394-Prymnesium_polylepis.1